MTPVTHRSVLLHELIGLDVRVLDDSNPSNASIAGKVVDETRNTLIVMSGGRPRRIAKKDAVFAFSLEEGDVEVDGAALVGRPEDRVKRRLKRRW
jgi:ribonuclease P protein subunit POP4